MSDLIIGSTAIKYWFPEFRAPKDTDYISKHPSVTKDVQRYWIDEFQELIDRNGSAKYLAPNLLYNLKCSHFGWDIHWLKTANDILFLKSKGCKFDPELYKKLVNGWIKVHGKKWAALKDKDAGAFFNDAVNRKYVHDDIHKAVAVYDEPLYYRILENENSVKCLERKFKQLSIRDQLLLVQEEIWVTALERYLIPSDFTAGDKLSYSKSLKKLITTMSSGWFKMFIIENYHLLYSSNDKQYITKFKQAEKEGKLRLENNK